MLPLWSNGSIIGQIMLSIEEIARRLQDRRPSVVAQKTGVSVKTIINVAKGRNTSPTYLVIKALSEYLENPAP